MNSSEDNSLDNRRVQVQQKQKSKPQIEIRELKKQVNELKKTISEKESHITKIEQEKRDLEFKWNMLKKDMNHLKGTLREAAQRDQANYRRTKIQAVGFSLLFLISSILVNLGTSQVLTPSSYFLGIVLLAMAVVVYLVTTIMSVFYGSGGGNP